MTCLPHDSRAVVTNQAVQTQSALGNSVNTTVTISFDFRDNSQLSVYLAETVTGSTVLTAVTFGSGAGKYTLSGGNPATTVVMGTAWTSTQYILVQRSIPLTQPVVYDEASAFPAADMATQMDQMVMMIQSINSRVNLNTGSLPILPVNDIFVGQIGSTPLAVAMTGDVTINSAGVTAIGTSTVTSDKIADGTIVNADVSASAAIASTKISFKVPTIQKFLTGSGTYTAPTNPAPLYLDVLLVGGGGGGGGSGTAAGGTGGTGGSTFLGPLVGNGGVGGGPSIPGAGGTATLGSGPTGLALSGGAGGSNGFSGGSAAETPGGMGGVSPFGGAGSSQTSNPGTAAAANTGSGGGGGGIGGVNSDFTGGGGGAGGYVKGLIVSPALTYLYAVGSAGTAGIAGTSGTAGGVGASGVILIEEHYQ